MRKSVLRISLILVTATLIGTLLCIDLIGGIRTMLSTPHLQAWVYPGDPACSAATELADGRSIDTLKAQYFTLNDTGTLSLITDGCNSYSVANAAAIKAHSRAQFVTISGSITGITALGKSQALARTFSNTLAAFLHTAQFTGVELDIEDYAHWTRSQYTVYKSVISVLGTALHAGGFQLMIDGPVIFNPTYQGYYQWKYEDFNALPVDALVSMCYDLQDDTGAGTPVASLSTITGCCQWMLREVTDKSKIVIGLNSYGYHGIPGTYENMPTDTYAQSAQYPGFATALRDASSGEMLWTHDGTVYDYSDTTTLTMKLNAVLATGLSTVSVWHLGGGNAWVTQEPFISTTPTAPSDMELVAFSARYPGFDSWYAAHFDAGGTYHG
jgi:Glycosyl hydrolases family 18